MNPSLTNLCSPLLVAVWGALFFAVSSPGCAHTPPVRPAIVSPSSPVGEIAIVDLAQRFVLIDVNPARPLPPSGAELRVKNTNGEESARLRVTPERKHPFIAADIVSGSPERGETVFP